jgi:hypothetical protein
MGQFFLGKLTVAQHVKIFQALYRIGKFIIVARMEEK